MSTLARSVLVVLSAALALVAGWRWWDAQRQGHALAGDVASLLAPDRRDDLLRRLAREPHAATARVQAARALLAEALAPPAGRPLPTLGEKLAQLEAARTLAAGSLEENPASWEGAMVLGAATYLARSVARDDRLFTEPGAWEAPLNRALELAPGQREPARFAAMAYLEVWNLLPEWKRQEVEALVAAGLLHPPTFDRLIGPWLTVAGDLERALELVPAEPYAWERLRQIFARRRDWSAYRRVTAGWRDVLEAEARQGLADAGEHLARGDAVGARARLLEVAGSLPVEGRYAPLLAQAVSGLPPGPVDSQSATAFQAWLDWSLELCLVGDCPLPSEATARLARALFDLPTPRAALAALAAGDLVRAESLERRANGLFQEAWAPYLVLKARRLAERGEVAAARRALAAVNLSWSRMPAYWQAQVAVARRAGEPAAARAAEEQLDAFRRASWPAGAWKREGNRHVLELLARRPAVGLELLLDTLPPEGAVVEARWDGSVVGTFTARPGDPPLLLRAEVDEALHRLELETLAGAARARPGAVALVAR